MQKNITGIVVKTFTINCKKICVLTQEHGKITVYAAKQTTLMRAHVGSVILCAMQDKGSDGYFAQNITLISQPSVVLHDLMWLHHLLEIGYFFAPSQEPAEDLHTFFENCLRLFALKHTDEPSWRAIKKCLIGCLLMHFGFYPPEAYQNTLAGVQEVLAATIDFNHQPALELLKCLAKPFKQKDLDSYKEWLLASIRIHPRIRGFKTLPFVYKTVQGNTHEKDL